MRISYLVVTRGPSRPRAPFSALGLWELGARAQPALERPPASWGSCPVPGSVLRTYEGMCSKSFLEGAQRLIVFFFFFFGDLAFLKKFVFQSHTWLILSVDIESRQEILFPQTFKATDLLWGLLAFRVSNEKSKAGLFKYFINSKTYAQSFKNQIKL